VVLVLIKVWNLGIKEKKVFKKPGIKVYILLVREIVCFVKRNLRLLFLIFKSAVRIHVLNDYEFE